jgi:protein TonB
VTAATGDLAGLEQLWTARRPRRKGALVGAAVALVVHVAVGAALVRVDVRLFRDEPVELEVKEPPPPPPDVKPEPEPPPPPPEAKPRIVMRKAPTPQIAPPPEPTQQEAEPPKGEAPPVFGVSLESTVGGDGPGMAVPVGNSLMTKPHKAPPPPPAEKAGDPDGLAAPVPEVFIAEQPKKLSEVKAAYPPEAQRMGLEGVVVAKLYIDEKGDVRRVTVVEKAGHGFDELARDALKKFKFSPARTGDGKAVPTNIIFKYHFEQADR